MDSETETHADSEYLSTLERGLSVLRAFGRDNPQMTLSEVAEITQLSPAAARRCLNTLVKLGYVAKHHRHFLLRPEVISFASAYLDSMSLGELVRPHLQAVRDETGDSSSLAVLSGSDILYLVHVSTNRMVRLAAGVGTRYPAYATSLGRAMLAFEHEDVRNHYLDTGAFTPFTEHTVTGRAELRKLFYEVRREGYSATQDELDYGLISIAVPILDGAGRSLAAINCSTSTSRVGREELIRTRLPILQTAARVIEQALQRQPYLLRSVHPA
ncbi:MAG TPA: IclR family transcriptional regulator C-terminal domain-containing protein [Rhizomicrobium sp.]|jgi:IclR family pca regulon transcriptional regulator|nr:IclR family transcriptional regulator C-terminal domain-containing protein [Rhizomicrobium sp.]